MTAEKTRPGFSRVKPVPGGLAVRLTQGHDGASALGDSAAQCDHPIPTCPAQAGGQRFSHQQTQGLPGRPPGNLPLWGCQ